MRKRATILAARLYPDAWRRRYGAEFDALLEESGGSWMSVANVMRGALTMRIRKPGLGQMAVWGMLGAVVAGCWAWVTPKSYVSTAVLRLTSGNEWDTATISRLNEMEQQFLSRKSLQDIIVGQDLYKAERAQKPFEGIVADMRAHDIRILPVHVPGGRLQQAFAVSYVGGGREQARHVMTALVTSIEKFPDVEVLDPPSFPMQPTQPNAGQWIVAGLACGLLFALAQYAVASAFRPA
jgi:hypothetical protein